MCGVTIWIFFFKYPTMLPVRDSLQLPGHTQAQMKGIENTVHTNGNQTRAEMALLLWDKINFKSKTVTRNKEGH